MTTTAIMQALASELDRALNGLKKGADRTVGFALLTFEFGKPEGLVNYVGNGERESVKAALAGVLQRWGHPGKHVARDYGTSHCEDSECLPCVRARMVTMLPRYAKNEMPECFTPTRTAFVAMAQIAAIDPAEIPAKDFVCIHLN